MIASMILLIVTAFLISKFLYGVARQIGRPFAWGGKLCSAKRSRGLVEQLGLRVKFELIKDEELGGDEPDCKTDHQRADRK